jgi:hypothetical protein
LSNSSGGTLGRPPVAYIASELAVELGEDRVDLPTLPIMRRVPLILMTIGITVVAFHAAAWAAKSEDAFLARFARRDLRAAEKSYGEIRVPEVPRGFRLVRVSEGGIGVDLNWHRESDDASIHLWQTRNGARLASKSDPSNPDTGVPIQIAGATWVQNTINACADTVCLSRRFPNGEVVSLNGTLPLRSLRRVAADI